MKYRSFVSVLPFFAFAAVVFPNAALAQTPPVVKDFDCADPLSLVPSRTRYHKFQPEDRVMSVDGYGIYSRHRIPKDMLTVADDGSISLKLKLSFGEPVDKTANKELERMVINLGAGVWYSIRREFTSILDLRHAKGIAVTFNVTEMPKKGQLRLTLGDLSEYQKLAADQRRARREAAKNHPDNLRFYESTRLLLEDNISTYDFPMAEIHKHGLVTLRAPFKKFASTMRDPSAIGGSSTLTRFQPGSTFSYEINIIGLGPVNLKVVSVKCYDD